MKITIKVLKGEECVVDATPDTTILEIKNEVEKALQIPIAYQKILQLGRTLVDEKTVGQYQSIKDGTKLTLVVRKPEALKEVIFRCFRKFYSETQSEKLASEFMTDFEKKIKLFSLDDLERLAGGILAAQQGEE